MTNLSAVRRAATAMNYFGDKWSIAGRVRVLRRRSPSSTGTSTTPARSRPRDDPDRREPRRLQPYNPAYWPCDELNGGDLGQRHRLLPEPRDSRGDVPARPELEERQRHRSSRPSSRRRFRSWPRSSRSWATTATRCRSWRATRTTATRARRRATRRRTGSTAPLHLGLHAERRPRDGNPRDRAGGGHLVLLTAAYKGGYSTSKSGTVSQVDLVPNFSLSPNPVADGLLDHAAATSCRSASAATLNSTSLRHHAGGGGGTLPSLVQHGRMAPRPSLAPEQAGPYTMTVTWNYTDHNGQAKVATAALPFTATDFVPVPVLGVYKSSNHTQNVPPTPTNPPTWGSDPGNDLLPVRRRDGSGRNRQPSGRRVLPELGLESIHQLGRHADRGLAGGAAERQRSHHVRGVRALQQRLLLQDPGARDLRNSAGVQVHGVESGGGGGEAAVVE